MGIIDSLLPANPMGGNLPDNVLNYARQMASLQLAASMLQPGIGRRRTFGESLGQGIGAYTGTQNDIINQALQLQRQGEQDALNKRVKEAQLAEYAAQADERKQKIADAQKKQAYTSSLMDMLNQKDLSGLPALMQQTEAAYDPSKGLTQAPAGITSMGAGLSPDYQKQYQGGLVDLLNNTANRAMDNAPTMAQQMTGGNRAGELALREGIASGKSIADLIKPISLSEGATLIDPLSGKVVAQGTQKNGKLDEWTILDKAASGDPQAIKALGLKAQLAQASRPVTTIAMPAGEKAFDIETGKKMADVYQGIIKDAGTSRSAINNLQAFMDLTKGSPTGTFTPTAMKAAGMLSSLGINVDPRLGPKQAAEALSNQMALQVRSTAEGGGMPGAMSDADRAFLQNSVPNLGRTPEGNRQLADMLIKMNKRKIEISRMANDYIAKKGRLDANFNNVVQDYADSHPLFANTPAPSGGSRFTVTEIK